MHPRQVFGGSPPRAPAADASLRVLVFQQGLEVECSEGAAIRRIGESYFLAIREGAVVRGPYSGLPELFAAEGECLLDGPGGRILEWEGLVLSVDAEGRAAGPFQGFDEWLWTEAETILGDVSPNAADAPRGRRVHHWRGHYFLSVDPLPACHETFDSPEQALRELRGLAPLVSTPRSE